MSASFAVELAERNVVLDRLGRELFQDRATLRAVDPRELVLLKANARYMKKEAFRQLVDNLREDARLSSVPLCRPLEDGRLEVLSGNHRVQASIEAGLELVMVMVLLEDLSQGRRLAVQLSHNALVGQDDPQLLAELWARIEDIRDRLYAGLDSEATRELEKVALVSFTTPTVATRAVTFAFCDAEAERVAEIVDELEAGHTAREVYAAELAHFDAFFGLLQAAKRRFGVKNAGLAMLRLLELAAELEAPGQDQEGRQ